MDAVFLSRLQFGITAGVHFLFPPISIGLAWMVVILEWLGWRRKDQGFVNAGRFFGHILALTFAVGVATGIVMEFQFGMNWSEYSKYVGDIFGAPLAAEGVFAFFLESGFLGLYLLGRGRVSKGVHWFSALMVAVGATISAFWILVANSWQQTPAGYTINNGRAELTNFAEAVFNPSTMVRFYHTMDAALICGAFMVAGVCGYLLMRGKQVEVAKKAMRVAVIVGLIASVAELMPFGHMHAQQVARTQPEKFAAIEGIYDTTTGAPLALFGFPTDRPPDLKAPVEIPHLLSWLAFGDPNAEIRGINEFPEEDRPPLWMTFVSFHNMVILGLYFIFIMAVCTWKLFRGTLWDSRRLWRILLWSIPLPVIACQFGWVAAEVGRQPWIVYHMLRTSQGASPAVDAVEVLISVILMSLMGVLFISLYIFLLIRQMQHGPEPVVAKEVAA
jgi:cytochrome d ubiquinol oxidase subunit I